MTKEDSFKNVDFFLDFIQPSSTYCIWIDVICLKTEFFDYTKDDLELRKRIYEYRNKKNPFVYIEVEPDKSTTFIYEDINIIYMFSLDKESVKYFEDKQLEEQIDCKKAQEELVMLFSFLKNN